MWMLIYTDENNHKIETPYYEFDEANAAAKEIKAIDPKVRLLKKGEPRKWNSFLFPFDETLGGPVLVSQQLSTRVAFKSCARWDHRRCNAVLIPWPTEVTPPWSCVSASDSSTK